MANQHDDYLAAKAETMGIDQVSEEIGGLKAEVRTATSQLSAIFTKLDDMSKGINERNTSTSSRLGLLEFEHAQMKTDIEKLTLAIDGLSKAINEAKVKGWKMVALYFAIAATSGGAGAASVSALKGILF